MCKNIVLTIPTPSIEHNALPANSDQRVIGHTTNFDTSSSRSGFLPPSSVKIK